MLCLWKQGSLWVCGDIFDHQHKVDHKPRMFSSLVFFFRNCLITGIVLLCFHLFLEGIEKVHFCHCYHRNIFDPIYNVCISDLIWLANTYTDVIVLKIKIYMNNVSTYLIGEYQCHCIENKDIQCQYIYITENK